jgi:alpha-D-xyloside xylohydrolase
VRDAACAAIREVRESGSGIEYRVDDTRVRVDFVTDRIVHVMATRNGDWSASARPMRAPLAARPGPVTARDEGAARVQRSAQVVHLPAGTWFDFWTGERLAGGRTVAAAAPLDRMPLHVRAGSIVPLGPVVDYASQRPDAPLELRIYPGADGDYTYYEDAGEGWGYERGEYALTGMHWDDGARTLTIAPRHGTFPGMKARRRCKVVVGRQGKATDIVYDGRAMTIKK